MKVTTTPQPETSAATLWRCGGRQCGAGECEHEENELHRHASGSGPRYAPPVVHDVLRTSGSPLSAAVRTDMEHRLGHDFADVRIHTDARASESALAVAARAYTVGRHVVFAPGEFAPHTSTGRRLLTHELTHAASSPAGRAPASGALRISSPDDPAERHATQRAEEVATYDGAEQKARRVAASPQVAPAAASVDAAPTLHRQDTETAPPPSAEAAPEQAPPAAPATPTTCVPSRRLTWADFTGAPPANRFHALTSFSFSKQTSGGRDWIIATFNSGSSWVRPRAANPGDRAQNGCAPDVRSCERFFDGLGPGETGWQSLGPGTGCAASPQPDTSLRATNRGECDSVLGTECDRVAALESARLLHHEQLHFDLACAMAAKGNAALAATAAPDTQTILSAVRTRANTQTTSYDTASSHGCTASGQSTWDTAMAQGLPAVTVP